MNILGRPLIHRSSLALAYTLTLIGLSQALFEVEGFGEYSFRSLTSWGTTFLLISTITTLISSVVLPLRAAYFTAGLTNGGIIMIALTLGRDIRDMAMMSSELPSISEIVLVKSGGYFLIGGIALSLTVCLTGICSYFARLILNWKNRKLKTETQTLS